MHMIPFYVPFRSLYQLLISQKASKVVKQYNLSGRSLLWRRLFAALRQLNSQKTLMLPLITYSKGVWSAYVCVSIIWFDNLFAARLNKYSPNEELADGSFHNKVTTVS